MTAGFPQATCASRPSNVLVILSGGVARELGEPAQQGIGFDVALSPGGFLSCGFPHAGVSLLNQSQGRMCICRVCGQRDVAPNRAEKPDY